MRSSTCRKRFYCTESSTFPAFPAAHGTGLNDGVWGLAAETIFASLPFSTPPVKLKWISPTTNLPSPFVADCIDPICRQFES
ncbi:hypothetical protein Q8A67_000728 [Cirrhinus molitorella]|uniref:Uncharacterized protein n=1 Tax=Cirrhinus molitorella TaxID=172907 RepID=A0AA88QPD5_9TELE|nr:hypothetical protein Q8A67_000728 [Cirrhinus molitorella]